MSSKTKRMLSTMLALAMALSLMVAVPLTASAASAEELAEQINGFNHGGSGNLAATVENIAGHDFVIVNGNVSDVQYTLELELTQEVSIVWRAEYSCKTMSSRPNLAANLPATGDLIVLYGNGEFLIENGCSIINEGNGNAINVKGRKIEIFLTAATVKAAGDSPIGADDGYAAIRLEGIADSVNVGPSAVVESSGFAAIYALEEAYIDVNDGTVRAIGDAGHGIITKGDNTVINVNGNSSVEKTGLYRQAIRALGANTTINVRDGEIQTSGGSGSGAIYTGGAGSTVNISGGRTVNMSQEGIAIHCDGNGNATVNVTGGDVYTMSGRTLYATGANTTVNVSGGRMIATAGSVITTDGDGASITISGNGFLEASNRTGIITRGAGSTVTVSGGVVSGTDEAIHIEGGTSSVTISGGFVFSQGIALTGVGNVISMASGDPAIGGDEVVCAWNKPFVDPANPEDIIYIDGTSTDMVIGGSGARAIWTKEGEVCGIRYSHAPSTSTGFYKVDGVAITEAEPESYTINFYPNTDYPMPSFPVAPGETVTRPTDPTKEGFIFAGWYSDAALTALYDFNAPVHSNISLYGKWTPKLTVGLITNFVVLKEYQVSLYTDVNEDEWYGSNRQGVIANAFRYGLMQGDSNKFNPLGNMTIAEAITIAARVHNIYTGGSGKFTQGSPWYQVYVDYAVANGIIGALDFSDFGRAATRAEMAYIFSNALPEEEFPATNTVNALPDVNSATQYYSAIIMLYKAGVLGGSDDAGTFNPGANITRAEAAAIISRVILPGSRFSGRTFG